MTQARKPRRTRTRSIAAALATACCVVAGGGAGAGAASAAPTVAGQWRFDEASGVTALDDGPFGLDGRLEAADDAPGTDPHRVAGLSSGALRFSGGGFVRLPVAPELEPETLTVEAVVRGDGSPGAYRYLVAHGAQACVAGSYGLYTGEAGGVSFYVFDGRHHVISAGAAPADVWDGGWHHVAGVFDGSALRLYVDGRPVGAPQPAPLRIAYDLASDDTYFGMYRGSCALALQGDVDLIRLWSSALGPTTVGKLSDAALAPPVADPPPPPPAPEVPQAPPARLDPPDAPSPRPPLQAATQGSTAIVASAPPGGGKPAGGTTAPPRACAVKPSVRRVVQRRRSVVSVRVTLRGTPLRGVKVLATQSSPRRVLASGRTSKTGRVQLRLKPSRRGTVTLSVSGRRDCGATTLQVRAT